MPKKSKPKASSLQYWPRKRAERIVPSVNWNPLNKDSGLMGFIGYKAGMVSVFVKDDTPDSMNKGKRVVVPATVLECPEMKIFSVRFYKDRKVVKDIVVSNEKDLKRVLKVPKKSSDVSELDKMNDYDDLRLIVYSSVGKTGIKKTPDMVEVAVAGSKEQKLAFVKEKIGKGILVSEVFPEGLVDARGVTKGKGLQGPVQRHGISLKVAKAEKGQRRPGSLAPWHPARVTFVTPMAGQLGFFTRVHYNNLILKVGKVDDKLDKKGGFSHFGEIKNEYIILKGSIQGPQKRAIVLTTPLRPTKKQKKKKMEFIELR